MSKALRIAFAGTPDFAAECLSALLGSRHEIISVHTQPDRPSGRGRKLTPGPVKQLALQHDIPVHQPLNFKDEADRQILRDLEADIMVVVAYGLILPKSVLALPRHGCLNVHASLLPRWRGAAPIARAIEAGDDETGVTIMQMAAGLDTGDMLAVHKTPITEATTAGTLHDTLAEQGAAALVDVLNRLGELSATPQDDTQATYARMLDKQEAVIDWQQPAATIARLVRAFVPWPVAHAALDGQNIRFWQATALETPSDGRPGEVVAADRRGIDIATGAGILRVGELQLPGKRRMAARDAVNGRDWVGHRFGT